MGPDLKEARKQGRKVGTKLLAQLIEKHKMWDITGDEKFDEHFDECIRLPGSDSRWHKAKKEFITAVEKIFVEDACNGF